MNEIIFLGTNGWFDNNTGHTLSILIKCDEFDIIFDAGSGFCSVDEYYPEIGCKPVYLFLSHLHLDHITGLHSLPKFNFQYGLSIIISEEYESAFQNIINFPYTVPIDLLKYKVNLITIPTGSTHPVSNIPFKLETIQVKHSSPTLAARLTLKSKKLVFITDTGSCEAAVKFANNSDILITECAHLPGEINEEWPHLNPSEAAILAKESASNYLYLTHFDANRYKTLDTRYEAEKIARKIFPHTYISYDGFRITHT